MQFCLWLGADEQTRMKHDMMGSHLGGRFGFGMALDICRVVVYTIDVVDVHLTFPLCWSVFCGGRLRVMLGPKCLTSPNPSPSCG